ncbi:uncharacterized protein LOC131659316 [Vicia villosa]|uniref:uncharacterized protein LOC131659316 n=1 Tax=Vicia villosa TaxID=3911 RepID=UPI00273C911C|nr:uncharacterized protein LOC131659316 [Vicia villosa]
MTEPWCRGSVNSRLRGPQKQEAYSTTINDLMLPNEKQWNSEAVSSIFDVVDTELILQVPLLEDVTTDTLIWKEEQDGKYSVRSGYRLWRNAFHRHANGNISEDWNSIWNIVAPPRVKHLLWRICSGCLPTRSRLRQRWNDWFHAQDVSGNSGHVQHEVEWRPPPMGWIKCNVDAAFNNNNGTTNRGWCMRNHLGNLISAGTSWDPGSLSVIEAEALALKEAILGAISMNLNYVIFESDCQRVTQAVHSNNKGASEFSIILRSISELLQSFPNFDVKFTKRQENMVAHSLARAANSWTRRSILNSIPLCIEHILLNESH